MLKLAGIVTVRMRSMELQLPIVASRQYKPSANDLYVQSGAELTQCGKIDEGSPKVFCAVILHSVDRRDSSERPHLLRLSLVISCR